MRKVLVIALVIGFCQVVTTAFAAPVTTGLKRNVNSAAGEKIVFVDLKRVFQEYEGTESATGKLKEEIKKRQDVINQKKDEVSKAREDYEKKAVVLSDEEKEKKSEEINKKIKDLQEFVDKSNKELKDIEEKYTKDIIKKIKVIIDDIGAKDGHKMILDKNERIVLFASDSIDITDKVLEMLRSSSTTAPVAKE